MQRLVSIVSALALLSSGCVSSTLINSIPPGAKVYVDGQLLGVAPVTQKDTAAAGSSKTVVLKLDGYKDHTGTIRKEEVEVGPLIGGILVLIPLIWVLGYPDQYTFELEKEQAGDQM